MKNKLLVLSLALSLALVGCGASETKSTTTAETESVEEVTEEVEETSEDQEEAEEESENEILWEKEETFADITYHIDWSKSDDGTIVIIHAIKGSDLNELAACVAMGLQDIQNYKDYPNVSVSVMGQSSNPDNTKPFVLISSSLGISGTEEDGTEVNDSPQWMLNADISQISATDKAELEKNLLSLYDKESTVADIYLE